MVLLVSLAATSTAPAPPPSSLHAWGRMRRGLPAHQQRGHVGSEGVESGHRDGRQLAAERAELGLHQAGVHHAAQPGRQALRAAGAPGSPAIAGLLLLRRCYLQLDSLCRLLSVCQSRHVGAALHAGTWQPRGWEERRVHRILVP